MVDIYLLILLGFALVNLIQFFLCICYILSRLKYNIIFYWHYLQLFMAVTLYSSIVLFYLQVNGGFTIPDPKDPNKRIMKDLVYEMLHLADIAIGLLLFINLVFNSIILFTKLSVGSNLFNFITSWLIIVSLIFTSYVEKNAIFDDYVIYTDFGLIFFNVVTVVMFCLRDKTKHYNNKQLIFIIKKNVFDIFSCSFLLVFLLLNFEIEVVDIVLNIYLIIYVHLTMSLLLQFDNSQQIHIWRSYKIMFWFNEKTNENEEDDLNESLNDDNKIANKDANKPSPYKSSTKSIFGSKEALENSPEVFYLIFLMLFNSFKKLYLDSNKKAKLTSVVSIQNKSEIHIAETENNTKLETRCIESENTKVETNQLSKEIPSSGNAHVLKISENVDQIKEICGIPIRIKQSATISEMENNNSCLVDELYVSYEENSFTKEDKILHKNLTAHFAKKEVEENNNASICEIDCLYKDIFKELLPVFHLSYFSILNSLDPKKNIKLFTLFYEYKKFETKFNGYWTKDLLLQFDLYDVEILTYLDPFIHKYKEYILTKTNNFEFTFLPLIIGVFKIKYFGFQKVLVLFRHPYAFSTFHPLKSWFILSMNDTLKCEIITSNNDEIAKQKDIEASESVQLQPEDFEIFHKTFTNDLNFLSNLDRLPNFKVNIFTINDVYEFVSHINNKSGDFHLSIVKKFKFDDCNYLSTSNNQDEGNLVSPFAQQKVSYQNIFDVAENSEYYEGFYNTDKISNVKISNKKYQVDSPTLCSLENVMILNNVNSRYLIKIYFKNLFKINDPPPYFSKEYNDKYLKK